MRREAIFTGKRAGGAADLQGQISLYLMYLRYLPYPAISHGDIPQNSGQHRDSASGSAASFVYRKNDASDIHEKLLQSNIAATATSDADFWSDHVLALQQALHCWCEVQAAFAELQYS